MQSDYQVRWGQDNDTRKETPVSLPGDEQERLSRPFAYLTKWQSLKRWLKQQRKHSLRNRKFFLPIDPI